MSKLILIIGPPASGKSTLAARLGREFSLPVIDKDAIKELLFDQIGIGDRAWSKQLGGAAYELFHFLLEWMGSSCPTLILEGNFARQFESEPFTRLGRQFGHHYLQVNCYATGELLLARFRTRALGRLRHPGHRDELNLEEMRPTLERGRTEPVAIPGACLEYNSSVGNESEYRKVHAAVEAFLSE